MEFHILFTTAEHRVMTAAGKTKYPPTRKSTIVRGASSLPSFH